MKNLFQEKFENFEDEPSRDVWATIETELRPKQAGIFVYRKYTWAVAASVAMFLGIGYFALYSPENQAPSIVHQAVEAPVNESVISPPKTQEPEIVNTETPVQTVANEIVSPTKATQSVRRIKTADGKTLIEKTETYIVKETKTYEVQPETKKEVQVAQSIEKQPVQSPTIVTPTEIKPVVNTVAENKQDVKTEPWKVYNVEPPKNTSAKPKPVANTQAKNTRTQLDLNHANPVQLASFASQQINKVANTPVKVNYKEDKKTNQVRYEIGFKDFKIVRKTKK